MPLTIVQGDITRQKTDAIVNAANSALQAGGGVCGAIFAAAGYERLQSLCDEIGVCPTGQAVYTDGLDLCRYIIHTVGPVYQDGRHHEEEYLYSAYRSALKIADQLQLESVAFPLISSGIYGYPRDEAFRVAVEAIGDYLLNSDLDVRLVIYDDPSGYLKDRQKEIREQTVFSPPVSGSARRKMAQSHESLLGFLKKEYGESAGYFDEEPEEEPLSFLTDGSVLSAFGSAPVGIVPDGAAAQTPDFRVTADSFTTALLKIIDEKEMLDPDVYRRANLDRKLFSKIRSDEHYQPSRNTAIALTIALRLSLEEANELLEKAGYRIGHSNLADEIIRHCFLNHIYNIHEVNELLFVNGQKTLGYYGQ
ncbi:MAG: macro domain-containing protein [Erysipelotrichaceae bacterium]|nr:macro domain-containing protein [Erysipelotrichaceae bacterium]